MKARQDISTLTKVHLKVKQTHTHQSQTGTLNNNESVNRPR